MSWGTADVYVSLGATVQLGDSHTAWFQTDMEGLPGLKRLLGWAMIAAMPVEALDETLQSLHEVWDFHVPFAPVLHPYVFMSEGNVAETQLRPGLVLEE